MPKVDPATGEPVSDNPDGPDELAGGKKVGDPALAGATETGGSGAAHPSTNVPDDGSTELPAEKGGGSSGAGSS